MNSAKRPTTWEEILGHAAVIDRLRRMLELDRLPHALLFAGPPGIGKRIVAEVFAARLLQTAAELLPAHPDFLAVAPDGNQIRIAQIREIQRVSALAPVRGRYRVCLLEPAEAMEAPAANSLLKILEEPPDGLIFILITAFPHSLLSTLRSRAAMVRFVQPAAGLLPVEDAETSAADREWAMTFLRNLQQPALEWLWPVMAAMEDLDNARILAVIKQWICVLRDIGVILTGCGELAAFNPDNRSELAALTGRWTLPKVAAAISLAEETRRHLQRNANSRLMLEALLIRSADLYGGGNEYADHRGGSV
jgi:DNA polymerase-3 subunit delta'